jgi:hypothetical protein
MKTPALTLLPLSLCFSLLTTEHASSQSSQIEIRSDSSPLSSDAILSAFGVLGLRVERFTYEAESSHQIYFELQEYRTGKLQQSRRGLSFSMGAGKQSFSIYFNNNTETMDATVEFDQHRQGWPAVPLNGLNATAWGAFENARVDPSTKAPIVGFAANSNSITSFDTSESLDAIASRYDLFVVVTAQIEKK